jgi:lyso-ornithine lipid O-acyltransferase
VTPTWQSADAPPHPRIGPVGWALVLLRGAPLAVTVFGGLALLLSVRLIERPLCGLRRPVTPHITQSVCRAAFAILRMRYRVEGEALNGPGAVVANHSSWLDIFALNAGKRVYFVSKSEVADWPGIGWLARATGTVFIRRDVREARAHVETFRARLGAGHRLLFFPEGTSTDGLQVLPFKPTLFAAFLAPGLRETLALQPVTLVYQAPPGSDPRFYGWWGNMAFGPHLLATLAARRQGTVTVIYHRPIRVADHPDRKSLARAAERAVRDGLDRQEP